MSSTSLAFAFAAVAAIVDSDFYHCGSIARSVVFNSIRVDGAMIVRARFNMVDNSLVVQTSSLAM